MVHFFSGRNLDRSAHQRKNKAWLKDAVCQTDTCFVLFVTLSPVVTPVSGRNKKLLIVHYEAVKGFLDEISTPIFLGVEHADSHRAWFALDVSELSEERLRLIDGGCEPLPDPRAVLRLEPHEAALVGQARAVLAWLDRYRFCPTCGGKTSIEDAGYKRTCITETCRSNKGKQH